MRRRALPRVAMLEAAAAAAMLVSPAAQPVSAVSSLACSPEVGGVAEREAVAGDGLLASPFSAMDERGDDESHGGRGVRITMSFFSPVLAAAAAENGPETSLTTGGSSTPSCLCGRSAVGDGGGGGGGAAAACRSPCGVCEASSGSGSAPGGSASAASRAAARSSATPPSQRQRRIFPAANSVSEADDASCALASDASEEAEPEEVSEKRSVGGREAARRAHAVDWSAFALPPAAAHERGAARARALSVEQGSSARAPGAVCAAGSLFASSEPPEPPQLQQQRPQQRPPASCGVMVRSLSLPSVAALRATARRASVGGGPLPWRDFNVEELEPTARAVAEPLQEQQQQQRSRMWRRSMSSPNLVRLQGELIRCALDE